MEGEGDRQTAIDMESDRETVRYETDSVCFVVFIP